MSPKLKKGIRWAISAAILVFLVLFARTIDWHAAWSSMRHASLPLLAAAIGVNILSVLIVQATIQFAIAILAEAALSYLGLGAQPPETSWGKMLADAQNVLYNAPRLALYPGVAIALSVLGLNLLGDGLRDALDPKLKARG